MDFKRKELAKNAKKNLKKHYWLLVAVCFFAAFIGYGALLMPVAGFPQSWAIA